MTQYSIDGGQTYSTGGIFTDLVGGEYKIKLVNDQDGCTFDTLVNLATIQCDEICADGQDNDGDGDIDCDDIDCKRPSITNIELKSPTQISCPDGDDGQILLECQNVTQYSIDGGQTYSTGGIFTDLVGGEYKIKLVNDQTGCTFDDTLVNLATISVMKYAQMAKTMMEMAT
ncbi:MAG: hypothetical protein R2774_04720 [Saprospiraceae bacterium]